MSNDVQLGAAVEIQTPSLIEKVIKGVTNLENAVERYMTHVGPGAITTVDKATHDLVKFMAEHLVDLEMKIGRMERIASGNIREYLDEFMEGVDTRVAALENRRTLLLHPVNEDNPDKSLVSGSESAPGQDASDKQKGGD